jgi:prophage antirepressor-like protein
MNSIDVKREGEMWITVKEASRRLGYHPSEIRRRCCDERLRAVKHANQWFISLPNGSNGRAGTSVPEDFPYLSADELCERLGLSKQTVLARIRSGEISGAIKFKPWAIPRTSLTGDG